QRDPPGIWAEIGEPVGDELSVGVDEQAAGDGVVAREWGDRRPARPEGRVEGAVGRIAGESEADTATPGAACSTGDEAAIALAGYGRAGGGLQSGDQDPAGPERAVEGAVEVVSDEADPGRAPPGRLQVQRPRFDHFAVRLEYEATRDRGRALRGRSGRSEGGHLGHGHPVVSECPIARPVGIEAQQSEVVDS